MKEQATSKKETAQQYWDSRSDLFANYYKKPSMFDRFFRKGIYNRSAVALTAIREFDPATVLDIGCGPGMNSVAWLKNSNAKFLTGIDFAENMVEYATNTAKAEGLADRSKFIAGDFMKYDFGNEKFDVAIAAGVLDYVEDAEAFLKRMAEVSNKAIVVSWPKDGLRMALRRYRYTCPVYHYTEEEVKKLHEKAGIKNVEFAISSKAGCITIGRK